MTPAILDVKSFSDLRRNGIQTSYVVGTVWTMVHVLYVTSQLKIFNNNIEITNVAIINNAHVLWNQLP